MYSKADMVYQDYRWETPGPVEEPVKVASTDMRYLDRWDGNNILTFIRSMARSWEWRDDAIRACQKLEKTIRFKLPADIQTYGAAKSWIEHNFQTFWNQL